MSDNRARVDDDVSLPGSRKRLLVVAYAFSPILGSEYRQAWELVNFFSRSYDVTVLFGDSDGLMGSTDHFDSYASARQLPFKAVKVEATPRQVHMARRMLRMPWGLFFPLLLKKWHDKALAIAQQLHSEEPFDVVHQLGPIGFRNPGHMWKLGCHSYWGPIGGAQFIDTSMIRDKWSAYYLEALFRNLSVRLQAYSPYIARAARGFDRLSYATVENARYFAQHYGRDGPVISDQGLYQIDIPDVEPDQAPLRVVWAGSLIARKNVDLLLDAIRNAPSDIRFDVVGDGPLARSVAEAATTHPNLQFHGRLPRQEVMTVLRQSDVILLTSLSEANTAILFEGLENGCIPIAPRIHGFVSTLNDKVAYLIDQGNHEEAVRQIVQALMALQESGTRVRYRAALKQHLPTLSWEALGRTHESQYV